MIKWLVSLGLLGSILAVAGIFLSWVKPNPMLSPGAPAISGWEATAEAGKIYPYPTLAGGILGIVGLLGALVSHPIPTLPAITSPTGFLR